MGIVQQCIYTSAWDVPDIAACYWYHTLDLPECTVHGQWDLRGRFDDYIGHLSVTGKRVLDIGTATSHSGATRSGISRGARRARLRIDRVTSTAYRCNLVESDVETAYNRGFPDIGINGIFNFSEIQRPLALTPGPKPEVPPFFSGTGWA